MSPRIFLIRPGETECSLAGRHTGPADIPLTARGEQTARELGQRLLGTSFAHVLTSPRIRARSTGELVLPSVTAEIDPDLADWDYGDDEGLLLSEILALRPGWNLFHDGCPGGETPAQISGRADRVIARLRALEGNVAIFSHGHFGRVLGVRWIGLPVGQGAHFLFGTASLCVLGFEPERPDVPVIAAWNATTSLFDAEPSVDHSLPKRGPIERWENEGGEIAGRPRTDEAR